MLRKGTMVRILTTNGGDTTARLLDNYHPTYDAVIESGNSYAVILADRIKTVMPTEPRPSNFYGADGKPLYKPGSIL